MATTTTKTGRTGAKMVFSFGERGDCPTSEYPKKTHRGVEQRRELVVKRLPVLGKKGETFESKSFKSLLKCSHCGAETTMEWCYGLL